MLPTDQLAKSEDALKALNVEIGGVKQEVFGELMMRIREEACLEKAGHHPAIGWHLKDVGTKKWPFGSAWLVVGQHLRRMDL